MILEPVDFLIFASVGNGNSSNKYTDTLVTRSLGPSKIAFRLREAGYSVQIINFFTHYSYEELLEISEPFIDKHTVIGISTTFIAANVHNIKYAKKQTESLSKVVKTFKERYNNFILLGGPSPPKIFSDVFNADLVVEGYAENQIVDVANKLLNHGVLKKHSSHWDIKTCNHKWNTNDCIMDNETLPLEIGRGCIFKCKFCRFAELGKKRGEYVRGLSLIRDEIIENYEKYKVTNYMLMEDTFNDDSYKLENWIRMVNDLPFKIQYTSYCRGDLLESHGELSRELYKSGLKATSIGIESFNLKAAKVIGKSWSGKKAKDFLPKWSHDICEGNAITHINLIVGLPGDTCEDIWSWLEWINNEKIGSAQTEPLIITKPGIIDSLDKPYSEFDLNAEKLYGYSFEEENPVAWKNADMTFVEAAKTNIKYWNYIVNNMHYGNWIAFSLMSLGYDLDYIKSKTITEINSDPTYIERKNNWFKDYKRLVTGK
jgi:radical SAM superfamily enzyme YgiQ (UPF0313 family)